MKYDLKVHSRSYKTTFMLKSLFHIRLWTDLIKICINANIMKFMTQFFNKCHFYVIEFFCDLRPSNLIITLTYVLMDNFCPCYFIYLVNFFYFRKKCSSIKNLTSVGMKTKSEVKITSV